MGNFFRGFWRVVSSPFRGLSNFLTFEPEDRPLSETFSTTIQQPGTLIEHIEALRKHLLRMVLALIVGVAVGATFAQKIIDFLAKQIGGIGELQAITPTETVGVFMNVALKVGFAIALPYIAFEIWLFIAPGLHAQARRLGLLGIPLALVFFLGGIVFAYYLLLPTALPFLAKFLGVKTNWTISSFTNFMTGLLFWIGISFEFPLVIYVITAMGLIKPQALAKQWRYAMVFIAVAAAAITPTVDPVSMMLVMLPLAALYFLSIGLSFLASAGRKPQPKKNAEQPKAAVPPR
jgi:sec-independent protein translocase protein TatC